MTRKLRTLFALAILSLFSVAFVSGDEMRYPLAVVADDEGRIFVADRNLPGIWLVENGKRSLFFQASKKFRTPLNAIRCLALDQDGHLLAGDSSTREVYRFTADKKPVPLTAGGIGIPMAIAVNGNGEIFVSDLELHRIWKVPKQGGKPVEFAAVPAPRGICLDSQGDLWVVSHGKQPLLRLQPDGKIQPVLSQRSFRFAHQVVVNAAGTAFVTDGYERAIWKCEPEKKPERWFSGEPLVNPVGLAAAGDDLLVADPRANAIFRIDSAAKIQVVSDGSR